MRFLAFTIAGLLLCGPLTGQEKGQVKGHLSKPASLTNDSYQYLQGNTIGMWLSNNGCMSHDPRTDGSGLEYPRGSGRYLMFTEGLLLGGLVKGNVHVAGATYRYGLQAGRIRDDGTAEPSGDPRFRVFRLSLLGRTEFNALSTAEQQRLRADFDDWPAADGAPWTDADGNGLYEPDFDAWLDGDRTHDAPVFPGREVAWYVSNDLSTSRSSNLYGTSPMGLEFQVFAWSGSGSAIEERTVFIRYTVINRKSSTVSDAFIARWADPDLGDAWDDLVGVDTTLDMMYVYNGGNSDPLLGASPPALGVVWLQTPAVPSPGSTARWGDGLREGYRNIPMSTFAFYINGSSVYRDPELGVSAGGTQMYNYLTGSLWDGQPYVDPVTNETVTFPLAGDPLMRSGWVDGEFHFPDDRRMLSACGPFTLAPGDTQQIVMATVVGLGASPMLAVQNLRESARMLKRKYIEGIGIFDPANVTHTLTWPENDSFTLTVGLDMETQRALAAVVRGPTGAELLRFPLFDDGAHGDGASGDGRYANTLTHAVLPTGGDLYIAALEGDEIRAEAFAAGMVPLAGPISLSDLSVISDHLDFNGSASPGENIVCGVTLGNPGTQGLGSWTIACVSDEHPVVVSLDETIPAQGNRRLSGLENPCTSLLHFDIPAGAQPGTTFRVPLLLFSEQYCMWRDTLAIPVAAPSRVPYMGLLTHVDGPACGTLGYTVADISALPQHSIRVTVEGSDFGTKTLTVRDHLGNVMAAGVPLPDEYGHGVQTIAGIRLRKGTAATYIAQRPDGLTATEPVEWSFSPPERSWFSLFGEWLFYGYDFLGSKITDVFAIPPVMLEFDRTAPRKAYGYVADNNPVFSYEGYYDIPVRAYDMRDATNPRPISLAFIETYNGPAHDHTWCPAQSPSDREYLLILGDDYSETPQQGYTRSLTIENIEEIPILYGIWPMLNGNTPAYENGDRFHIIPRTPVSSRDTYMLDLSTVGVERGGTPPVAEVPVLYPNYPNPFSASTRVAYQLPAAGHVELAVYDALGRKIRTVVSGWRDAGAHVATVTIGDARPGVYYCRLTAGGHTVTRRMVVLR